MQFPDRTADIAFHKDAAHRNRQQGDHAKARAAYTKWVESERQQNIRMGGSRERELEQAKQEFSDFARTDPLYLQILDAALPLIREESGILQTNVYLALPQFERASVQYTMYFAEKHGAIVRTKKGRTYTLSPA